MYLSSTVGLHQNFIVAYISEFESFILFIKALEINNLVIWSIFYQNMQFSETPIENLKNY